MDSILTALKLVGPSLCGPFPEVLRWLAMMLLSLLYPLLVGLVLTGLLLWLVPGVWKVLALVMVPLMVGVIFYMLGWLMVRDVPASAPGALRVAQLNVLMIGGAYEAKLRFMRDSQADVVSLIEVSEAFAARLHEIRDIYPFVEMGALLPTRTGVDYRLALLSKHKLERVAELAPELLLYRVVAPRPYYVLQVHPAAPYTLQLWQRRTRELALMAAQTLPQPLVVVGDFNAVPWDGGVRKLAAAHGLRVAGAWGPTYPSTLPLTPIDLLLLPERAGTQVHRVRVPGTDHAGVVVDILTDL